MVFLHQRAGSRPQRTAACETVPRFLELLSRLFRWPREIGHCGDRKGWVHALVHEEPNLILKVEELGRVQYDIKTTDARGSFNGQDKNKALPVKVCQFVSRLVGRKQWFVSEQILEGIFPFTNRKLFSFSVTSRPTLFLKWCVGSLCKLN